MIDDTEMIRREMVATINADPGSRPDLEAKHGQVWDTSQLQEDFQVLGFMAPVVVVRRRSNGIKGSRMFQNSPRFYYSFSPERPKRWWTGPLGATSQWTCPSTRNEISNAKNVFATIPAEISGPTPHPPGPLVTTVPRLSLFAPLSHFRKWGNRVISPQAEISVKRVARKNSGGKNRHWGEGFHSRC